MRLSVAFAKLLVSMWRIRKLFEQCMFLFMYWSFTFEHELIGFVYYDLFAMYFACVCKYTARCVHFSFVVPFTASFFLQFVSAWRFVIATWSSLWKIWWRRWCFSSIAAWRFIVDVVKKMVWEDMVDCKQAEQETIERKTFRWRMWKIQIHFMESCWSLSKAKRSLKKSGWYIFNHIHGYPLTLSACRSVCWLNFIRYRL